MNEISVSIIVPCYNCEKYIEENIISILRQTYTNFEVIYINDGSSDNTLEILRKYENTDSRIKVIDSVNKGVSHARNTGLDYAKGEYILFVDSDDYIDNQYLERLYNATENKKIDYVRCLVMNGEAKEVVEKLYVNKNDGFKEIYNMLLNTYQLSSVWCGIVKKQILKNNNIRFKEDYNYAEDYMFNIEIFKNVNNFKYLNYQGYYYRKNEESLTNKFNEEKFINQLKMAIKAYKELYVLFPQDKGEVDKRIEREVRHILDSLFYATNNLKLKERLKIYEKVNKILLEEKNIFNSFDLYLIINKHNITFDLKNYITKKIPRKLKQKILKIIK